MKVREREREGEIEISQVDVDKTLRYLGQRYCDVVNFNQSFQRHSAKQSFAFDSKTESFGFDIFEQHWHWPDSSDVLTEIGLGILTLLM